ncbi:TraB/GumN family protein [Paraflavisolibacter sp. H34]|uniref:TraB/GumN family protein n=1 Tax=Huijunlia imazamoxiresistens TaxID=3127457 RepID=UPI00301A07F7
MWEISGPGLKKPSYLFGTMHVSSKMVFNLSDSFYLGIRQADVVALETNPESWQEDMFNFNFAQGPGMPPLGGTGYRNTPSDYLTQRTLKVRPYEKLLQTALVSHPSTIDNLLYRSYSEAESDFEEDTYLDLYIYQVGKKWGKKIMGVERYEESMKLMMEAYLDAMKDKNRRDRSAEQDEDFSYSKLQDAYRTGNLDLLDTINRLNSFSAAFDEKFLYRRNEIQAESIDSIIRSGASLFVGVGAAHLPGQRGVIELLRQKGYRLRPVKMGARESTHKEAIEKMQVPIVLSRQVAEDGFFRLDVPGKLYRFSSVYSGFDQQQYADMANGSYYMVTRVQTAAPLRGQSPEMVLKKVDSLLYENIPGRILSRQPLVKNGYKGYDILNKTRRGDYQRYQIFVTPFEVLFFKVSGNGDYVKTSKGAERFFSSIELKEYLPRWTAYTPPAGGFTADLPHEPYVRKNGTWQFMALDRPTATAYEVVRTDLHNYEFVEEDTFDLSLMEESFTASDFFDKTLSRRQTTHQGYPALEAAYRQKDGSIALVKYIIQGPHYYTLVAQAPKEHPRMRQFLSSFTLKPFVYGPARAQSDTALSYTVTSPVDGGKKGSPLPGNFEGFYAGFQESDDGPPAEKTLYRDGVVANDTTGEKVYVSFFRSPRYQQVGDSAHFQKQDRFLYKREADWVIRSQTAATLPDGMKVWEYTLGEKGSSRMVWTKLFYRDGMGYAIRSLTDTLTPPSDFLATFYKTFRPADSLKGAAPGGKKTQLFFADFFSSDTVAHKRAVKSIDMATFDTADFDQLKRAVESLSWKEKNYLEVKSRFLAKMGELSSPRATDYLQSRYYAAGDTIDLQYAALENLVAQQTAYAFGAFKNILINEPPVLNMGSSEEEEEYGGAFIRNLYDSLQLTATLFPDLLPLVGIDDYKWPMMRLMGTLVDSNLLPAKKYAAYLPTFQLEAKQAWKKQLIAERNKSIEKARSRDRNNFSGDDEERDYGNDELSLYATLLLPFWEKQPAVPALLNALLGSTDKRLRYNTALLYVRRQKPLADSILVSLAADDAFRYDLYTELNRQNKGALFPKAWSSYLDLAKSKLLSYVEDRPDSVVYLDKLPVQWQGKDGFVYFFKYKRKAEDNNWKIASSGLVLADGKRFEPEEESENRLLRDRYDFTGLLDKKLNPEQPVRDQLQKALKQLLYSKRNSAREFYRGGDEETAGIRFGR